VVHDVEEEAPGHRRRGPLTAEEIERAFHRKYDGYMTKRSPARCAYFVFGRPASAARRSAILARIAEPSKLL